MLRTRQKGVIDYEQQKPPAPGVLGCREKRGGIGRRRSEQQNAAPPGLTGAADNTHPTRTAARLTPPSHDLLVKPQHALLSMSQNVEHILLTPWPKADCVTPPDLF